MWQTFKGKPVSVQDVKYDEYSRLWFGRVGGKAVYSHNEQIWKRVNDNLILSFNCVMSGAYRVSVGDNGDYKWLQHMAERGAKFALVNGVKLPIQDVISAWEKTRKSSY